MIKKILVLLSLFTYAYAGIVPCNIKFVKNTCWQPFTVTVDFTDVVTQKKLLSLKIDDKSQVASVIYNCSANQAGKFDAKFSPAIWKGDDKKTYSANHIWQVPPTLPAGSSYYEINVCFPDDFQGVPTPTYYFSNCHCPYPGEVTKKKTAPFRP